MTRLFISLTFLLFVNNLLAQDWYTNFEAAIQDASSNNKNIVLLFQGSDWCAPCIKLDKEILGTPSFQNLSRNHFVMLQVDFPRKKKNRLSTQMQDQNNSLAERYNPNGFFPLVVLIDLNEIVLGSLGYEKISPEDYYKKLVSFEK